MFACLLLLGPPPHSAGPEPSPELDAVVDRVVQRFLADHDIPGAAVGLVRDGALVYAKGHGVRSVERHEPVVANTLFQIGSVTKVFTTTLMLQLRDEGRLVLDEPVRTSTCPRRSRCRRESGGERVLPTLRHLAPTGRVCRGIRPTAATVRTRPPSWSPTVLPSSTRGWP